MIWCFGVLVLNVAGEIALLILLRHNLAINHLKSYALCLPYIIQIGWMC